MTLPVLGWIGLGNMGLPMAVNLVNAGYQVYGLNRSKGKEAKFAEAGGRTGLKLPELAASCDTMMTCLPMPSDVREMYMGPSGIVAHARAGQLLIDFSTVSVEVQREISEAASRKGVLFLDAPVSGGTSGAAAGTLSVMVGGDAGAFERAKPIFDIVGSNVYHVGPVGSGTIVKLINQLMVGIHTQAAAEALTLAEKMGVGADKVFPMLNNSFAQSRILDRHYTNFVSKDHYEPGFALKLLHKDVALAEQMAGQQGMSLPLTGTARALLEDAKEAGLGELDMSAMFLRMKAREESGQ